MRLAALSSLILTVPAILAAPLKDVPLVDFDIPLVDIGVTGGIITGDEGEHKPHSIISKTIGRILDVPDGVYLDLDLKHHKHKGTPSQKHDPVGERPDARPTVSRGNSTSVDYSNSLTTALTPSASSSIIIPVSPTTSLVSNSSDVSTFTSSATSTSSNETTATAPQKTHTGVESSTGVSNILTPSSSTGSNNSLISPTATDTLPPDLHTSASPTPLVSLTLPAVSTTVPSSRGGSTTRLLNSTRASTLVMKPTVSASDTSSRRVNSDMPTSAIVTTSVLYSPSSRRNGLSPTSPTSNGTSAVYVSDISAPSATLRPSKSLVSTASMPGSHSYAHKPTRITTTSTTSPTPASTLKASDGLLDESERKIIEDDLKRKKKLAIGLGTGLGVPTLVGLEEALRKVISSLPKRPVGPPAAPPPSPEIPPSPAGPPGAPGAPPSSPIEPPGSPAGPPASPGRPPSGEGKPGPSRGESSRGKPESGKSPSGPGGSPGAPEAPVEPPTAPTPPDGGGGGGGGEGDSQPKYKGKGKGKAKCDCPTCCEKDNRDKQKDKQKDKQEEDGKKKDKNQDKHENDTPNEKNEEGKEEKNKEEKEEKKEKGKQKEEPKEKGKQKEAPKKKDCLKWAVDRPGGSKKSTQKTRPGKHIECLDDLAQEALNEIANGFKQGTRGKDPVGFDEDTTGALKALKDMGYKSKQYREYKKYIKGEGILTVERMGLDLRKPQVREELKKTIKEDIMRINKNMMNENWRRKNPNIMEAVVEREMLVRDLDFLSHATFEEPNQGANGRNRQNGHSRNPNLGGLPTISEGDEPAR